MLKRRLPWEKELAIIDDTMRAISGITDPEELVGTYWDGIGQLLDMHAYIAVSRRGMPAPEYLVTRSSQFEEHFNPWTQRDRLPRMSGGLMGEIVYGNKPVIIEDLPSRLSRDDPAWSYLQGFQTLIALPQYEDGEGLNVTASMLAPGIEIDHSIIPMMHWQSGLFGRGTTNLVLKNQLARAMDELNGELQVVGDIQRSLLPSALPKIAGFELAASYQTSAKAGGDYYDFFPLDGHGWGMFIADVSGHGTPAAVLMAITHAIAHGQPGNHTPPATLLEYLNDQLTASYTRGGTFITAFYAVLDPVKRTLTYSRAGHNPPRLVRGNSVVSLDKNGALPLGIQRGERHDESTITLQSGDLLLLYTDGITEGIGPPNGGARRELFGLERLDELLLGCGSDSAEQCIRKIKSELCKFCQNAPPSDDQTLIAIRCV